MLMAENIITFVYSFLQDTSHDVLTATKVSDIMEKWKNFFKNFQGPMVNLDLPEIQLLNKSKHILCCCSNLVLAHRWLC